MYFTILANLSNVPLVRRFAIKPEIKTEKSKTLKGKALFVFL